jgi:folylpolyglutamate synthase/dihydropteroate synthase
MGDKPVEAMVAALAPLSALVVATRASIARAASPTRVAEAALRAGTRAVMAPDVPAAVDLAMAEARSGDLVLVAGSLFAVGEARAHLGSRAAPPAPGGAG